MARKRNVKPNPEMLRLLAAKKEADAKFARDMKAAEEKRKARREEVALLIEECGALDWPNADLRTLVMRGVEQRNALPKAA